MFDFFRKRKIAKLERELCKRRAELEAARELYNSVKNEVPGAIVLRILELPGEIASLEKHIEQLKG